MPGGGSYAGQGIARAGDAIAQGIRENESKGRQTILDETAKEIHGLQVQKMNREIQLDDAMLLKMASDEKYREQRSMWGMPGAMSTGSPESQTYPYGVKVGPALDQRPITAEGRRSLPMMVEQVGPKGRRMIMNPALGDEVAQVYNTLDPWVQYAESFANRKRWQKRRISKPYRQTYKRKW